ncbi:MAG: hypothetical protein GF344_10815 [Chitinivibrionales bacterium]|nr:hypothetical protein [Chitinivibrionales bacterium]MBD3357295.1 hypothetical protein [Chitinivibrionales bacterium]
MSVKDPDTRREAGEIDRAAAAICTGKVGRIALSDQELLILAAQALARTYTFAERGYAEHQGAPPPA